MTCSLYSLLDKKSDISFGSWIVRPTNSPVTSLYRLTKLKKNDVKHVQTLDSSKLNCLIFPINHEPTFFKENVMITFITQFEAVSVFGDITFVIVL